MPEKFPPEFERGEVWLCRIAEPRPVVLLSPAEGGRVEVVHVVEPATPAQRHGFLLLTGEQAAERAQRNQLIEAAGSTARAVGIEVLLGVAEGLREVGAVRVALPMDGTIFCSWLATVETSDLTERIGALSELTLQHLDVAVRLGGGVRPS